MTAGEAALNFLKKKPLDEWPHIYIYYVINQQTIIMFSDVSENAAISSCGHFMNILIIPTITHRIHVAGIYANINGVY